MEYNKTQLDPDKTMEKHVFHRDQFAHYLRWTHVLKTARIGMNILDVGCGTGNLLELLYRNMYKPGLYVGIDIREKIIEANKEKFKSLPFPTQFYHKNVSGEMHPIEIGTKWDIIVCFEVLEHMKREDGLKLLKNLSLLMTKDTVLLLSTPCHDSKVGAAANHIIDGVCNEYTFEELKFILADKFKIEKVWGTFASQKDYKPIMSEEDKKFFEEANEYFDSNIISNLMAFKYPNYARNCLWRLRKNE